MLRSRSALAGVALACAIAGCGVRAPAPVDVAALIQRHGPIEARRELERRVISDPRDVGARLALAALNDELGRPSAAIEQLEAVVVLGGPLGTRWHDADRARLGRLLVARARARIAREAPTALADLDRARELGIAIDAGDRMRARRARAIAHLRHVDAKERAAGKRMLIALAAQPRAPASWRGARANAGADERGELGVWLWSVGAKRAAWEELAAWHDATNAPQANERLQGAYLAARAWWSPSDAPAPPRAELVGPERCRFREAACDPWVLVFGDGSGAPSIAALVTAPTERARTVGEALAWMSITLTRCLRGEVAWGPAFASRVDLAAIPTHRMPPGVRAAFARLAGRTDIDLEVMLFTSLPAPTRFLVAASRALRGASEAKVRAPLGELAETEEGRALLRIVAPPAAAPVAHPYAAAVVGHVRARVPYGPDASTLRRIVHGYARDPLIADRLGRDAVAASADAAAGHAALGAMFDALGDPARARASWQAAVAVSPEPALQRGLASALGRANDPDAALIVATTAAAASGDPAVVWVELARSLAATGEHVHALEAARSAIDLASPEVLAPALEVAILASRALGRVTQVEALRTRRAAVAPPPTTERDHDPTDAVAALAAHVARPTPDATARLWTASRWNPRDVAARAALLEALAAGDPRRHTLEAELVALAADRDPERGRAAVAALRPRSSARRP